MPFEGHGVPDETLNGAIVHRRAVLYMTVPFVSYFDENSLNICRENGS